MSDTTSLSYYTQTYENYYVNDVLIEGEIASRQKLRRKIRRKAPREISANIIFDTFQHNGVLEVDDVDVFMQDIVMKGRGEHKLLSRLQGGVLERIRLVDAVCVTFNFSTPHTAT